MDWFAEEEEEVGQAGMMHEHSGERQNSHLLSESENVARRLYTVCDADVCFLCFLFESANDGILSLSL
jgi:hypothetical protein